MRSSTWTRSTNSVTSAAASCAERAGWPSVTVTRSRTVFGTGRAWMRRWISGTLRPSLYRRSIILARRSPVSRSAYDLTRCWDSRLPWNASFTPRLGVLAKR
ncbi:hypothetical protein ACFQX7_32685 [Luedemannella flava]